MIVQEKRFCDECGAANRSTGKFCVACGKPLSPYAGKAQSAKTGLFTTGALLKQRYRIGRKIGQGGFSAVYFVEDMVFNAAPRVVKEMSMQWAGSQPLDSQQLEEAIECFKREALLLATLTHPNLPRIYDHFEEQQRWYIVMDYIDGQTLEALLEKVPEGKLELPVVLHIATQLCTVLNYLHTRQPPIIFRDLKPANIMVTEDEHVYLIDFGIARLFKPGQTSDTVALGSPGYAALEQYGRTQSDALTDIYSLGATLHQLLSGHDPSNNPFQFPPLVLNLHAAGPRLASLIQHMTMLSKEQRPANVQEVKQELQKLALLSTQANRAGASTRGASFPSQSGISSGPDIDNSDDWGVLPPAPGQSLSANLLTPKKPSMSQYSALPSSPASAVIVAPVGGRYSSISSAIKDLPEKTRILVRPGTYTESIVLDKNVEIIGDGPREQIVLISNGAGCIRMATNFAVIRGMTIQGLADNSYAVDIPLGRLHLSDCIVTSEALACIGIRNSTADPLIQHCVIRDGKASGIFVYDQGAGVIEDCEIFANELAGVTIRTGGRPIVRRCKIHDGQAGGVFVHDQGEGTFEDCEIYANKLSGVEVKTRGQPVVRRCKIHDGQAGGVFVYNQGAGTFEDCEIYANELSGVAVETGGKPLVRRCLIRAGQASGIYVHDQGAGTFEDCTTFANKTCGLRIGNGGNPVVRRCNFRDGEKSVPG